FSLSRSPSSFLFYCSHHHRDLHSFPTRRSSDLLMTAPGIPMLFMGQEILEDKPWCDDVSNWPQFLVWWDGLKSDRHMREKLRPVDRKSTRLNSSHVSISYAVFCLKKKKKKKKQN